MNEKNAPRLSLSGIEGVLDLTKKPNKKPKSQDKKNPQTIKPNVFLKIK